ncbi:ADP ribosylation factor like GTPase 3, like 1 isoform X1 [Dicentrarchus labrax]|uniref:ADP ribosylation factor like GTPase 3, like 1 isoform X1 n=1 Tax=Dicentrarchus labrax TaxID=13489 RepID=UPI0021F51BA6|nr:ADP ribosylation factor like GTPase 3, like 1 isoform X1 [Dicentrarchus labrax]XP_051275565.1 ADP ribosylation factor like GTPase 3, like 1 isoform X1 [Dicentrarchus labrax]
MVMRKICLCLLLGHLLIAVVGSDTGQEQCLKCDIKKEPLTDSCLFCPAKPAQCLNASADNQYNCTKDFQVCVSSSGSAPAEGDRVTLTCVHNFLNLTLMFGWKKDEKEIPEGQNQSELVLEKVFSHNSGQYICFVKSEYGCYESLPHEFKVNESTVVILVICGVAALVLVVIMGLAMKFKLKRDNAKHKERMKQRAQIGQSGAPAPFTPRGS